MSTELKLHCFFCGGKVRQAGDPAQWVCGGCKAMFRARRDPEGCVIGLEVQECGTPDCCRHREKKTSFRRPEGGEISF